MKEMLDAILQDIKPLYVFIIIINIVIFAFAKWIVNFLDTSRLEKKKL